MSEWTAGEPTLAEVQTEFAGWHCWRDASGRYFARRAGRPRGEADVQGEDPRDLRDQILGWIGRNA